MLEMLNPTAGDVLRFAATAFKVSGQLRKAMKRSPTAAQALAVELFCTPPESARRAPTLQRLQGDSQRYFGWRAEQWQAFEPAVSRLMATVSKSQVLHTGLKVQCYHPRKSS